MIAAQGLRTSRDLSDGRVLDGTTTVLSHGVPDVTSPLGRVVISEKGGDFPWLQINT